MWIKFLSDSEFLEIVYIVYCEIYNIAMLDWPLMKWVEYV